MHRLPSSAPRKLRRWRFGHIIEDGQQACPNLHRAAREEIVDRYATVRAPVIDDVPGQRRLPRRSWLSGCRADAPHPSRPAWHDLNLGVERSCHGSHGPKLRIHLGSEKTTDARVILTDLSRQFRL